MTRDEAIAKLREVVTQHNGAVTHKSIEMSVDGYAALGLLKLEEPKPEWHEDVVRAVQQYPGLQYTAPISVIYALERAGLRVVRA